MDYSTGRPVKRPRSGGPPLSAQKKGQLASIRFNKLHPWNDWGAARIERGSAVSLQSFGPTYREASDEQKNNRKIHGFTGRGQYMRQLGMMAGSRLGGMAAHRMGFSRSAGKKYGAMAGGALVKASGYGEYKLRGHSHVSNNLIASTNTLSMMSSDAHTGAIVVTRSELVKDITPTSTGFQSQFSCDINPGLNELNSGCFDWLNQIAQYYEQYEFEQVLFEFKSTVSPGNTTAAGTVIMAPLQVGSEDYSDKNAMSYAQGQASAGVAEHILCGVECQRGEVYGGTVKRTRVGVINGELINYDLGRFQLATQDATANLNIGELWVHYTVRLSQPRFGTVSTSGSSNLPINDALASGDSSKTLIASQTVVNLFGFTDTFSQIAACTNEPFVEQQYGGGILSTSSSYRYYTGTSDTTGAALTGSNGFIRFKQGFNFVNRTILFSLKAVLGSFSATTSTSPALIVLRVVPTGNASYVADGNGDYVRCQLDLTKVVLTTSSIITYSTGIEIIYQFAIAFGSDDSLDTALMFELQRGGGGTATLTTSTVSPISLLISDVTDAYTNAV